MSAATAPSSELPPTTPDFRAERDAYFQGRMLAAIERGAERLDGLASENTATFVEAYERITKSMRQCMMMSRKLDEPVAAPAQRREVARRQVLRAVEDKIAAEAPERAESLHAELLERLDRPDFDMDLSVLPVAQVVADLCRDLGLGDSEGVRRTPADVDELNARAAAAAAGEMPKAPFVPDPAAPKSAGPAMPEGADSAAPGEVSPAVREEDNPAAPGEASPAVPGEASPAAPGEAAPGGVWRKPADQFGRSWRHGCGPAATQAGPSATAAAPPMSDEEFHRIVDNTPQEAAWDLEFSKWKESG